MRAAEIGCRRHTSNVLAGRRHRYGAPPDIAWQRNIEGTLGELALSLHTGHPWDGALGDFSARDVGPYQVRATHDGGSLILHHDDSDEQAFVLAQVGSLPEVFLAGWAYGHEVKRPEHWRDDVRFPAFFLKRRLLRPMDTLPR